jgi:hypothetical protein
VGERVIKERVGDVGVAADVTESVPVVRTQHDSPLDPGPVVRQRRGKRPMNHW